ncbi:MAG: YrdB family protein [Anaerolineales bacterium]
MIETLKAINSGLAFFLELAMLTALGYWGFHGDKSILAKCILGIGLPLLTVIVWGMFLAPRATYRLSSISGNLLSLFLFLLAATVLFYTRHSLLAIIFASIAVANRVLILFWRQW